MYTCWGLEKVSYIHTYMHHILLLVEPRWPVRRQPGLGNYVLGNEFSTKSIWWESQLMLFAAEVVRRLFVVQVCRSAADIFNDKAARVGCWPVVHCVVLNEV